jgi:hypothetical protein
MMPKGSLKEFFFVEPVQPTNTPKINLPEPWRSLLIAVLAGVIAMLGGSASTQVMGCHRGQPPAVPTCPPTQPAPPEPKPEPSPTDEPIKAIGRIVMSGGYCSGTVVGPLREDGHAVIVSAAHCFKSVNEKCTFHTLHDAGRVRSFPATVIAMDRKSDAAILVSDSPQPDLHWVVMAEKTPPPNSPIWHAGFGRHVPGNVEKGRVLAAPNSDNQVQYWLSVSPGDSGGGILVDANGHLLSPVCCTTRLDAPGNVWGASPEQVQRMLRSPASFLADLVPQQMPAPPAHQAIKPLENP